MYKLSTPDTWRALAVGLIAAVATGAFMLILTKLGISPFPKPLALAFAAALVGHPVPLPIGLVFHLVYVTFWGFAYVYLFRNALTLLNATWLGLVLWAFVLVLFFPYVGWGFFGLAIGPKLIIGSLITHALFVLFVWLGAKWLLKSTVASETHTMTS